MKGPSAPLPPTLPAWAICDEDGPVGVDYLGTRQANLDMLSELTGVYNNQVRSARQHAILAWTAWRFRENVKDREEVKPSEFRTFLEAVETIQMVGQHELAAEIGSAPGGLGSGSWKHWSGKGSVALGFGSDRTHETSALAAVQYGPSARSAGLGFLDSEGDIPVPTDGRGRALADALDRELRKSSAYIHLTHSPGRTLPLAAVLDLARHGLVLSRDRIARPEIPAYIDALFGFDGRPSRDHRSKTLALLLHLIGVGDQLSADMVDGDPSAFGEQDVRVELAAPDSAGPVPEVLQDTARRWQLFIARQLQRFALEAWQALLERWMDDGVRDVPGFLQEVEGALAEDDAARWRGPAADAVSAFDPVAWVAGKHPWRLAWDVIRPGLQPRVRDLAGVARAALDIWIGSTAFLLKIVPTSGPFAAFAATGTRQRISMTEYQRWWRRREGWTVREVLGELLEEFVLQQHVGVAVARFDNQRRRLRFCGGEEGWTLLPGAKSNDYNPDFTRDRLGAALALLHDVALLDERPRQAGEDISYKLTSSGRATLERFLAGQTQAPST